MKRFDFDQQASFSTGIQTNDNGYFFLGQATYHANVLFRLDSTANLVWKKDYGYMTLPNYSIVFRSMIETQNGDLIMMGSTPDLGSSSNGKSHLMRLNNNGDTLWSKRYLGGWSSEVIDALETSTGDLIIVGESDESGTAYNAGFFAKLTSNGDTIWSKAFAAGVSYSELHDVIKTTDSNYVATGFSPYVGGGAQNAALVVKFNDSGDTLWTKSFLAIGEEIGSSLDETNDGGFVFCGRSGIGGNFNDHSGFIIRTDELGNTIWKKQVADSCLRLTLTDVIAHPDGTITTYGYSSCDTYLSHKFLIKLDANGNEIWTRRYINLDGIYMPQFKSNIQLAQDGGYVMPSSTIVPSFANFHDMVAVKLNPYGYSGSCNIDETSFQITNSTITETTPDFTFIPMSLQPEHFNVPIGNFNYTDSLWCSGIFPVVNLGQDTVLCPGESTTLSVNGPGSILWQDGSTDSTFTVTQPGLYWVSVTYDSYTYTDTILVDNCLEISESLNSINQVKIYPNPSNGILTIKFSESIEADIELYDLKGTQVESLKTSKKSNTLNLSDLEPGVYYLFLSALNENYKRKIVIQ